MRHFWLLLAVLILAGPAGVRAASLGLRAPSGACATLSVPPAGALLAASWAGDGSLALSDGQRLVPAGVVLPSALNPQKNLSTRAATAAEGVLDGRFVQLGATTTDRHGRLVGDALLWADGEPPLPLAFALLEAGAGYADPRGAPPCAGRLLAAEDEARRGGHGIFATGAGTLAAASPAPLAAQAGLFTVAQGRVRAAGATRDKAYLNFGQRWREDFTIVLPAKDFATILGDDLDPAMLRGTLVRVRGVVREAGGPAIFVHGPGELEILSAPEAAPTRKGEDR